jgi:hypothetical protein
MLGMSSERSDPGSAAGVSASTTGEGWAKAFALAVLAVALFLIGVVVRDAWRDIGQPVPGFGVMEWRRGWPRSTKTR